ncbi:MAG: alpha/beta fold hydrolase [Calditrichaeota bacterium]|nr:MAG: alpha/beta fold hydrolase [Calditrichota bacterium]
MNKYAKSFGIFGITFLTFFSSAFLSNLKIAKAENKSLNIKKSIFSRKENMNEIEIIMQVNNINIGGTLTIPPQQRINSLVIMSSGSGPQDRDETLDGFKIFKEIAKHLSTQGIATFRYDDRGVGESTGDFTNSTLQDHSEDLKEIMNFFKSHKKYQFKDFILFGHSQGGIVTANVAAENQDVKKIVLMGAPSVPLIEVVLYQVRQEYISTNLDKALIEAEVSAHNRLMRAIKDNNKLDKALKTFKESSKSILSKLKPNEPNAKIEKMATNKTNEFEIVYALPSLTSFLYYDPSNDYERLQLPVLGLFGGKDLQVTIEQNKDRMENALLKSQINFHFVTFDDANHYFQKAKTGQREEYGTLDKKFVDGFLEEISTWILNN